MSTQVLIADDEALIRQSLKAVLADEGFTVSTASSGTEAWSLFQAERPDVVLLDLVLGDTDGIELLKRMRQLVPDSKVILISAHGSIESAVTAMKVGGYDFIKKPFEVEEIVAAVRNAARTQALEQRVAFLAAQEKRRQVTPAIVHASPRMKDLLREAAIIAASPAPMVLITGESGTGKQAIARLLHDDSPRAGGAFVELNCSAIPENLVESELFGHERGAFSDARERKLGLVEIAEGGTLFLDEVGDLGAAAQAKLLTFLEQRTFRRVGATATRHVDARIVAATNRDLAAMVKARTFREDLFYRLNALTLHLAPLRERREDIAPLAEHFLAASARELSRRFKSLTPEAMGLLRRYPWPGNVRELKAVLARAVLLHDDDLLRAEHLPATLVASALASSPAAAPTDGEAAIPTLEEVELAHLRRVLEICGGNRTLAAQRLGITRQTLTKRLGGPPED
ncbi:MAG TPA: sigma-54 dependent transcriptional regulator [Polyangia bacterium]|nr:sigma-54 dependent transcriptional regulator [Polyangia bacterium]